MWSAFLLPHFSYTALLVHCISRTLHCSYIAFIVHCISLKLHFSYTAFLLPHLSYTTFLLPHLSYTAFPVNNFSRTVYFFRSAFLFHISLTLHFSYTALLMHYIFPNTTILENRNFLHCIFRTLNFSFAAVQLRSISRTLLFFYIRFLVLYIFMFLVRRISCTQHSIKVWVLV